MTTMKNILVSLLVVGSVTATVWGASSAFFSDTETSPANNLTAGKVDLKIDSTAHYNGMVCDAVTDTWLDEDQDSNNNPRPELLGDSCEGSFTLVDLTSEKFFNLLDVKPGDYGENTISIHITDNPVWACVDINGLTNAENTVVEPEGVADLGEPGELGNYLHFSAWRDDGGNGIDGAEIDPEEGNNIYDDGEEVFFANALAPSALNNTYALAESGDTPLSALDTHYVGFAWCFGTMNPDMTCDGTGNHNDAQTDSLTADIAFRVEQSRNNPDFLCNPVVEEVVPTP